MENIQCKFWFPNLVRTGSRTGEWHQLNKPTSTIQRPSLLMLSSEPQQNFPTSLTKHATDIFWFSIIFRLCFRVSSQHAWHNWPVVKHVGPRVSLECLVPRLRQDIPQCLQHPSGEISIQPVHILISEHFRSLQAFRNASNAFQKCFASVMWATERNERSTNLSGPLKHTSEGVYSPFAWVRGSQWDSNLTWREKKFPEFIDQPKGGLLPPGHLISISAEVFTIKTIVIEECIKSIELPTRNEHYHTFMNMKLCL